MARTYESPITKEKYTAEEYAALTTAEKREAGFYHDVDVVYETVEDKVTNFSGEKEFTLEAFVGEPKTGTKIPVSTIINGMQENHFNFNGVEVKEG